MHMNPSETTARDNKTASKANASRVPLTIDLMRQAIAERIGVAPTSITESEDLIGRGLDSLGIMSLANRWRRDAAIKFSELMLEPTLAAWWKLVSQQVVVEPSHSNEDSVDEFTPFALAPMQQAYWIGSSQGYALGGFNAQYYIELDGPGLDSERLERALLSVQVRHPMLRARFLAEGLQQIMPTGYWTVLTVHDLRSLDQSAIGTELQQLRENLSSRRLAVDRGEVFDVQLTRLPDGACRLHVNMTMVVCDARSFQIILQDLSQLYLNYEKLLAQIDYSFQKYLRQAQANRQNALERDKQYWHSCLAQLPGAPALPLAISSSHLQDRKVGRRHCWLPPAAKLRLSQRSREHALPLSIVFATAFAEVIGMWSEEARFLLNLPLFDREEFEPGVGLLVGDFTNGLIVDVDVSAELSFYQQAKRVQERLIERAAHSAYPGVEVLRDLARLHQDAGVMAPVVFTSVIGMGDLFSEDVRQCFGSPAWITSQTPQVWLDHQIIEHDGGLLMNLDFVEKLFPHGVIDGLFDSYQRLLGWAMDPDTHWDQPVPSALPTAQADARRRANATADPRPTELLHAAFFRQAALHPERMALGVKDQVQVSYGALALRALSVGAALLQRGIAPGDTVAITISRGPDQIAAVLGTLAAGAVFVPVSIDQPASRREHVYSNSGSTIVLTSQADAASLEWPDQVELLAVEIAAQAAPLQAPIAAAPDSPAYIIYTSGSTGQPKGVEMSHAAANNTIVDINSRFAIGADDRVLAVSALEFDLSVYDIFGLLSAGGAIILVEETVKREAARLLQLALSWQVTIWNSVPALLAMLLISAEARSRQLPLRLALISGDWIDVSLPRRLKACAPNCAFFALGGATEAAIWSNAYEVDQVDETWRSIPYGFPLRNQKFRIVDGRGRDRPDFVPGELWIGGAGLAAGYRNDPQLTRDRFVLCDGERWYRTGDLGRYWPDGTMEFLGRIDSQVKIHGYRIELGEVEATLQAHPLVSKAVAFVTSNKASVAAAVISRDCALDRHALRMFAADRLPPYMVPIDILSLQQMPLNDNGKIDRKTLTCILAERENPVEYEAPHPGNEAALAVIWSELLGQQKVGRHSNFFALGGDSLRAMRLVEMIRQHFGAELSLHQLLANSTIANLWQTISLLAAAMEEGAI